MRNRSHIQTNKVLQRQTKARLTLVEKQIDPLDTEIGKLIEADKTAARHRDILRSIPGLGQVASAAIRAFLPEIGPRDRRQVGRLAGVVPHARQSGQWNGKAFISGGRKPLRDALYMPALVVRRFNSDLKDKYQSLRAAGKPAKATIVAIMRKLIETANALVFAKKLPQWQARDLAKNIPASDVDGGFCIKVSGKVQIHQPIDMIRAARVLPSRAGARVSGLARIPGPWAGRYVCPHGVRWGS